MQNRNKDNDNALDELFKKLFDKHDMPNIKNDCKAYHITITDNSTGKQIVDADTNCICGGYAESEEKSATIGFSKCNLVELLGAVNSARKAVGRMTDGDPLAKLMLTMAETME